MSTPTMDLATRAIWLAKHLPDPGYTLLHESEAKTIQQNLAVARRDVEAFKLICAKTANALGDHFHNAPNLWEGAQHAVFRAEKEKEAADVAMVQLRTIEAGLTILAQHLPDGHQDHEAIQAFQLGIDGTLRRMRLLRDARPSRKTAPQVAAGIILDLTGKPMQDGRKEP